MSLAEILRRNHHPAANLLVRDRPDVAVAAEALAPDTDRNDNLMDEYAKLSAQIGVTHPHIEADLRVERFKAFLRAKDWSVFSLSAVITYMDAKAAEESAAQAGWRWRPLREKDNIRGARFGTAAAAYSGMGSGQVHRVAASDHYAGSRKEKQMQWSNSRQGHQEELVEVPPSAEPYDKLVPIHALRKVAAIEAEYHEPVAFFVCDYAPAPHIQHPDPFLMAVIDNPRLAQGVGRFVIDFWDEPGFGLEQQVAAD